MLSTLATQLQLAVKGWSSAPCVLPPRGLPQLGRDLRSLQSATKPTSVTQAFRSVSAETEDKTFISDGLLLEIHAP